MIKYFIIFCLNFYGLLAQPDPPELFEFNQSTVQAFYFIYSVQVEDDPSESSDWVGAFKCQEWDADFTECLELGLCVGSRMWDTSQCGDGVCDLPLMGDDGSDWSAGYLVNGDIPELKIYDYSAGVYFNTVPSDQHAWVNFGFFNIEELGTGEIYQDCFGSLGGNNVNDDCGNCNGSTFFGIETGELCDCLGNVFDDCNECGGSDECLNNGEPFIPDEIKLHPLYPNPFNPQAVIEYELPVAGNVQLEIYNLKGILLMTLVNYHHSPGAYSAVFDGSGFASGFYLVRLTFNSDNLNPSQSLLFTQKVLLAK